MSDNTNTKVNNSGKINYSKLISAMWAKRKLYFITLPVTFLVSSLLILSVPRYYSCEVKLAPETDMPNAGGLSSLASSFLGTNMNLTSDAIQPLLYPDLIKSKNFLVSLFPIKIETNDGTLKTNYFTYLKKHQKKAWWSSFFDWFGSFFEEKTPSTKFSGTEKVNAFKLTKEQNDIVTLILSKVKCNVDKKTDVISITVTDQDNLICATIADSIRNRLQAFITEYRTNKARTDFEYYKDLTEKAKANYEKARRVYGSYGDTHTDVVMPSYQSKVADLENDMQLKYNTYSTLSQQLQMARAKVQERTPAFTILQTASVPIKPLGPKRMIFVAFMLFLAFCATTFYIVNSLLKNDK